MGGFFLFLLSYPPAINGLQVSFSFILKVLSKSHFSSKGVLLVMTTVAIITDNHA